MCNRLIASLTFGVLGMAVLTGAVSARDFQGHLPGMQARTAYSVGIVSRTDAITPRAGASTGAVTTATQDSSAGVAGTLHLFGSRTDATPF